MSNNDSLIKPKKRRKSGKKSQKISFDAETVPKHLAKALSKTYDKKEEEREHQDAPAEEIHNASNKKRDKTRKRKAPKEDQPDASAEPEAAIEEHHDEELDPANSLVPTEESNRAKKRKKHQQLLLEKKVKADLAMQDKSLNYLSRWKHSRNEWKFEKLRQVWLQQNLFDCDKVPDQFWDTLIEYFNGAMGKVRKTIIDDAVKIIEQGELVAKAQNGDDNDESNDNAVKKLQRARNIIQCLQE